MPIQETSSARLSKKVHSFSLRELFEHFFVQEKDPSYILFIVGAVTLLGFVLRVLQINQPIAYDEAYTFINFASRSFKYILADYSAPNNHIFHTILVGLAYRLFGGQPWVLRLPAFVAGTLMTPMMYVTARRFFSRPQALAAADLAAVVPVFINYSVNGRGYTMLFLFALLLTNFAAILVNRQSKPALVAYGLTAALGFYTIPIFLYPMAGVSLWVVLTYLVKKEPWRERMRQVTAFLGVCMLAGMLTLVLYSPVMIFGSGLSSIVGNEFVESQDWSSFLANLGPRLVSVWEKWMIGLNPAVEYLLLSGFLLSLFFYRKASNQKLPLQLSLVLALVILLAVQRVTPTPRIWLYLETFYLLFAAAGLAWLAEMLVRISGSIRPELSERILSLVILMVLIAAFVNALVGHRQFLSEVGNHSPEEYAANYLADHLQPEDILVATSPVDIETAYYLSLHGISFDRFYKRDHPVEIRNAILLVRENSKHNTPERVVNFYKLDDELDLPAAELVFEYANVQVYSIPAK